MCVHKNKIKPYLNLCLWMDKKKNQVSLLWVLCHCYYCYILLFVFSKKKRPRQSHLVYMYFKSISTCTCINFWHKSIFDPHGLYQGPKRNLALKTNRIGETKTDKPMPTKLHSHQHNLHKYFEPILF